MVEKQFKIRIEESLLDDLNLYLTLGKDFPRKKDRNILIIRLIKEFLEKKLPEMGYIPNSNGNMTPEHLERLKNTPIKYIRY